MLKYMMGNLFENPIGVDYTGDAGDAAPPDYVKIHVVPTIFCANVFSPRQL